MTAPNQIVSLLDMQKIDFATLLQCNVRLATMAQAMRGIVEQNGRFSIPVSSRKSIAAQARSLADICTDLDLPVPAKAGAKIAQFLDKLEPQDDNVVFDQTHLPLFTNQLEYLVRSLNDALENELFVSIKSSSARFYNADEPLFGQEVEVAFPSSSYDISEAGKCRALGRWTACVMHLMRALEPSLLSLQAAVSVDVEKEQWGQIIDQIEAKIRQINKATHSKHDEKWFSEAASHFRVMKNGWRNYAQHLHERYDEERAVTIYDSVRAFMRHLASRLAEPQP